MFKIFVNGHFAYVPDILMIHNDRNPLNCYKVQTNNDVVHANAERKKIENYIRGLPPYQPL